MPSNSTCKALDDGGSTTGCQGLNSGTRLVSPPRPDLRADAAGPFFEGPRTTLSSPGNVWLTKSTNTSARPSLPSWPRMRTRSLMLSSFGQSVSSWYTGLRRMDQILWATRFTCKCYPSLVFLLIRDPLCKLAYVFDCKSFATQL